MPRLKLRGTWDFEYRDAAGVIRWREHIHNVITTAALADVLDVYLKSGTQTATWYMGLKGTGAVAAANTLASHAAWTEITDYSGDRQAVTFGAIADGAVDNSASINTFTFTGDVTVAGGFLCAGATGTSALLFNVGNFTSPHVGTTGGTLDVTVTITAADDGV